MTKPWFVKFWFLCVTLIFALIPLATLQGKQDVFDSTPATDTTTRADIIAIAKQYAEHKWKATSDNVHHGLDEKGNQVDTPDKSYRQGGFVVDAENVGIPYQWGGFSSIEEFEEGIREGKLAGHLPKRGSSPASPQAVGVDCSGFVSRCWDLPRKHSTRSLGNICYELDSFDDLKPGDIINSFDGHVVIFDSFADSNRTKVVVYEAGGTRVAKNVHSISKLKKNGFKPLRYKPLDHRWLKQKLGDAKFVRGNASFGSFEADDKEATEIGDLDNPLQVAKKGDWVRYSIGSNEETLLSVTKIHLNKIVIRNRLSKSGKVQLNERQTSIDDPIWKMLVEFGGFDQDFGELKLVDSQVQAGQFKLGDRAFDAQQIQFELEATLLVRQIHYPAMIKIECVISEQVALAGVITSRYEVKIKRGSQVVGKTIKQFELLEFLKS